MKLSHVCRALSLALWAATGCLPAAASRNVITINPVKDMGRVLFVGDSITHGKSSGSWRWELFKILVDNGISWEEVGIQSGNYNGRGGVVPGTKYRGVPFANRHAAQFSEKAAEVAGRVSEPSRMGGTGIRHWLRLDGKADGSWQLEKGDTPDTVFLALGTNDFVAEHCAEAGALHAARVEVLHQLLGRRSVRTRKSWNGEGDMDTIVEVIRQANRQARIVVVGLPTFGDGVGRWCHKAITPEDFAVVPWYNEFLSHWGQARKVRVLDMNEGFRDVCKAGAAVADMLVDQMHPNAQGNLIYAGNVAGQLGYAGRTAGLPRKDGRKLPGQQQAHLIHTNSGFSAGGTLYSSGQEGATLEFYFAENSGYGNGAEGGWNDIEPMQVSLNTATQQGTLCISESALSWGGRTLYSADMSEGLQARPIRIAWVAGDEQEGIARGFYVWLGDMLIGEALPGEALQSRDGATPEPSFSFYTPRGSLPTCIGAMSYDLGGSWAPPTALFTARKSKKLPFFKTPS